ncbi:MAG: pantetheine-phosphate adenylyltransferase [Alphaproteobacteria bacterium]|nr:MAG: pantetheine-phosphate adenylyltransferase [Alphaproteobacteria bacterium]
MSQRIAVYPGTFDPITFGHMDIIQRAARVVDHLIIGVAANAGKGPLFSLEQRAKLVETEVKNLSKQKSLARITVKKFDVLLMDFVRAQKSKIIVRGLRAVSDFEYEFQMAGMNAKLDSGVETLFLMASDKYQLISSRFVKEIAQLGGDVSHFVSPNVLKAIRRKYAV